MTDNLITFCEFGPMGRDAVNQRGPAVEALQIRLREHGYKVRRTGVFNETTEEAVREFQKARGLVVDGVVWFQTAIALEEPVLEQPVADGAA